MPGVTVLPNSPGLGGFGTSECPPISLHHIGTYAIPVAVTQSSPPRPLEDSSVQEIKAKARETVRKTARGISAPAMLKSARSQLAYAKTYESQGDLKSALNSFTMAASLAQMMMDTAEYSESKGKAGGLRKEFKEFLEVSFVKINANVLALLFLRTPILQHVPEP